MNLRYGKGLYFSSISSKSHSYNPLSEKVHSGKTVRSMLMCKVVAGNAHNTKLERLEQHHVDGYIASGYDSIIGLTTKDDGKLNYDEIVVYDKHAALPSYLVVYEM